MSTSTQDTHEDLTDVAEDATQWRRPMQRRSMIAGIAALGLAAGLGTSQALAQDATSPASEETGGNEDDALNLDDEVGAVYQDFVAKFATSLGELDPAIVDTAIRDALKAMVDERLEAGEISQDLATRLKEKIDTSETPLLAVAIAGHGNARRGMKRRHHRRKDRRNNDDSSDD